MAGERLGIDSGVRVEGVGELYWAESYSSYEGEFLPADTLEEWCEINAPGWVIHYATPNSIGGEFKVDLKLDEPFRHIGRESVWIQADYLEGIDIEHNSWTDEGSDQSQLPLWFIDFLRNLQIESESESLQCIYECDPEENGNPKMLDITVNGAKAVGLGADDYLIDLADKLVQYSRIPSMLPLLEQAYREQDATTCYRLLEAFPYEATITLDGVVFQLARAIPEEVAIMSQSTEEKREVVLLKFFDMVQIIKGQEEAVSIDDFFPELRNLFSPLLPGYFSHTHPSTDLHPFPSWGDVMWWQVIQSEYPKVENRVVFNGENEAKALRFVEFQGKLFPEVEIEAVAE